VPDGEVVLRAGVLGLALARLLLGDAPYSDTVHSAVSSTLVLLGVIHVDLRSSLIVATLLEVGESSPSFLFLLDLAGVWRMSSMSGV
jgi:hypothetical protein